MQNSREHVIQDLESREIPANPSATPAPMVPTADVRQLSEAPIMVPLDKLYPHPQNPRLVPDEEIIEKIRARLEASGFDPAYALIVRPYGDDTRSCRGIDARKRLGALA
jgi:hypothetical protein